MRTTNWSYFENAEKRLGWGSLWGGGGVEELKLL